MTKELVICDICGKEIVKPDFNPSKIDYPIHKYTLKISQVSVTDNSFSKYTFDLCPKCYEKLISYIGREQGCAEGGLFNVLQ